MHIIETDSLKKSFLTGLPDYRHTRTPGRLLGQPGSQARRSIIIRFFLALYSDFLLKPRGQSKEPEILYIPI